MPQKDGSHAALLERLRDFDRVAKDLKMRISERVGVLNVTVDAYQALLANNAAAFDTLHPGFERRLSYALPLMKRLASNTSLLADPPREPRRPRRLAA